MSNFIRPWDVNQEAAAEEAKPKRGLFDNLGDAFSAISANFDDVRGSERLGDLRNELMNPELSDEEYNRKRGEYVQEYLNREDARRRYAEAHQNLVNDDSFLKNIDQMGGTLEGMAAQGIGTAVGAGVGFLTPVVGGTAMGAKIGNAAGAVAGAHLDARSVALQAEEDVINAGGTWELAKQAYDETLKKAYITTIPETAADIVLGSRIGGAALNSGIARKIAGSTAGRVGASVLDPAAKIGTAVSRATRPIIGRGAGLLTDIGLQAGTEALQEVSQDYIADREVAKALGKQDNEYSLGGFKDYALSPQGLETIKTSAIMGGLFGGVGGVLSSGQYLQRGSDTVMGNKGYHAANDAIQEGLLKLDDSGRLAAEKYIHLATGVSEAELATWSDADIISQYASSFAKRHNPNSTESMDASVTRGIAEAVRTTVDPKEIYGTREGDLTASQKIVLEKMGIDPDTTQEMFSSPAEKSVMEKAREEVSESQNEEDKPAINAKMSAKLKEEIDANNGKTVQEVHQEETAKNGNTNQLTTGNTDGVIDDIKYKNKVGNIEGEEWIRVPYTTSDGQELEGARYENKKTGKTATITQNNDGTFSVRDESNVSAHVFNTLEDAEKFLNEHRNDTRMFMKEGTDNTSEEIQDPNVVPEGGVNAETSGYTGVQINNISDLSSFMDKNQGLIDPEWFRQFIAITRSISPENWLIYLDTKNKGYVYENGRWGEVRGYADKDKSMGRAIVQLYAGQDIGTVIHEIAHHGFWNLSERDRDIFTRYATKSMGKFVANLLDREYDNNFIAELRNIKEGDELYNKIISNACLGLVKYLLNTLNLQSLGITDISKVSPDLIELFRELQRKAVEERWAWEFSNWYVEGYVKGYTGNNIIDRILQRGCKSMEDSLTCIQKLWEHLHHRNSEGLTPIEDLYRSMNHPRELEQTQSTQELTQSNPEQEQFTNEFYNPYEFEGNPDIEQPTQFMDSSEYMGDNTDTNNLEYVGNEEQNYNTQELDFGNQELNSDNTQGLYYYNPNDNSYNESEEESQLNIKMTDETAEIFADEMLRRYGDNYELMKSVWLNLYRNAKSRREQNWLVRMMRIAAKKYKEGLKANTKQTRQNTRQTTNNIGIEQRQVSVQSNQPVGVQERNLGYFNPNPLQLNQAQEQEKQLTRNTQQQEEQQKKPNVLQLEEVVDNNVEEEVEEKWTIRGTVGDTNERLGKIYKLGLEPREIDSIHLEINEVLDELEGESDKTVTKIRQSVTKRINAAKAALRGSKKSVDRGTDFYKLCSMSSLEETLNHYLDDNYYANGGVNQEKVNLVGNLIKRQLGEEMEEWAQPYSDETERAGRREKSEADRIEKERKQAEKEAKKKQQQLVESASQRLDILEQQVRNLLGEELTDEELEEKLENEVKKDNVVDKDKSKKTTNKKKTLTAAELADRKQRIRATAERLGMVVKKEDSKKNVQVNDVVDSWVEKLSKEEDYDEAMSKLLELLNTNEITEEEYNDISKRIEDYFEGEEENTSGRSYQKAGSTKAELAQSKKEERAYQESADRIIRFMGVSLDRKAGSVSSQDMEQEFHKELKRLRIPDYVYLRFVYPDKIMINTKNDKNAKRFIKALMKINEKIFENGNIYRGLDGKWRYWIDDRKATLNEDIFDLVDNFISTNEKDIKREQLTIDDYGFGDEEYRLSEVLNHDEFFKLCPEASDVTVQFTTPEMDRDLEGYGGYYLDGKIVINLDNLRVASNVKEEGLRRKLLKRWLMGVLLHETQHFVQDKDYLARGFNTSGFMLIINDKDRVADVVDLLMEYKTKILKDEDDNKKYGAIFDNKERLKKLLSSHDYEDYWKQVEIAGMVKNSKLPMDFYYRSLGEEEARFTGENWSEGTTEEKYYIGGESFDLEDVSTAGYLTENGNYEFVDLEENLSDTPKLKERLAKAIKFSQKNIKELLTDLKRLQNSTEESDGGVVSRSEAINMTKDEIKSERERIKVCKKILQKLKEGYEIIKGEEEVKPKVPMNSEEYFKDLTSEEGDYVHIDKRFQKAGSSKKEQLNEKKNKRRYMIGSIKRQMLQPNSNVNVILKLLTIYKDVLRENGVDLDEARNLFKKDNYILDPIKDLDSRFLKAHVLANEEIWKLFKDSGGFFLGLDGKWKFWFSDKNAKLKIPFELLRKRLSKRVNETSTLSLDKLLLHDLLFKYYPELKNIKVTFKDLGSSSIMGLYNPKEKNKEGHIDLNVFYILEKEDPMTGEKIDEIDLKIGLLHELQHAIQDIENFAQGGSSYDIFNYDDELTPIINSIKNKLKNDKSQFAKKILNSSDTRIRYLLKKIPKLVEGTKYKDKYLLEFWDEVKFLESLFYKEYEPFLYYIHILGEIEAQHSGYNLQKGKLNTPPVNDDIKRSLEISEIAKEEGGSYNPIVIRKKNTRRFMNIGKGAKGSPITQDVLNKVEKEYNEKMQDKGVSVIQLLQMKYRNELSEKQGRENVSDIDDAIFSREYILAHDEVNKEMFKKYKLFRGLDGEWRYRISDNTAKLTFDGIDMQEEARDNKLSGFSSNAFYKLGDLLKHNTLFKYYPELKDINVQFIYDEKSTKVGNYIDGENGSAGTLTINLGHGKFINKKTLNSQIVKTFLHEIQHAILDKEGFASGGITDSNALYKKNAVGFIHRNKLNIINSFAKFLLGKGLTVYEMEMNGNKQEISDSMEKNVSGDFIPVVYINKQRKSGIQGGVLFSLMMSMNDAYFENATLSQRDFDFVRDMLQSEKEIKYLDKLELMFKDGKFNMGFSTLSFTKELALNKAKQELSFLNNKKGIEKVISEYELGYGNNEAFETALDESGLEFDFYRSLYGEMEARDTAENYRNKNRNRFVPISEEGEYIKAKLGSGQVRINKRRYMAALEKTATEKAQEQRDKRLEQQREAGITSDMYKDVYSVTFEKDATSNAENKRKMEYFDKRSKFWDKTEKNGRVIYTRKTPLDHHQKVIRYSGINDVEKTDKKKSKPEQWLEWAKDQLIKYAFNDMHFLAKAARKLGVYDSYVKLAVTKGYALKANTAMQRGIKYNGKYTRALNDIIKEVGEEKQHDFVEYCIAKRILDMKELRPEIRQKMSPEEAQDIVNKVEKSADAKLFMKNQKDFVQYNHALLHVLVDGGVISEEEFQHHIKNDPNFVPLAKVMDDADFGFNCIQAARSIVNVKSPIKKIGTSMREVKNPFLEMLKRTAEYYAIASRNKAGQIFVNEIAGVLEKNAKGDTIAKGLGMIRKVKINEKDGKLITKPDLSQQIIYISNNGKQEFYLVSDPEIYRALRALDADQMGTLHKMLDPFLHAPSALIRETATMVPDFGVRNLVRDGGEAFMTSEHGFLPLIDQIWGMYQMANNTEWYQRFLEQQGEYGTYNREGANDNVARVEDTIDEKVNVFKNFNAIREAAFKKLTNKKNSKLTRAAALLQLVGSIPYAFIKSNKRINDYLEMGTRIGEFKNAKMGYGGTLDRLSKGGILDWGADINKAKQSDILAAGAAKEITLNFSQHGIIGKQLNRYIPFFNATLQGIYKMCNALELMATGTTLSGEKNSKLQHELLFKAALTTAMAIGIAAAGEGDDDYEEANQYEKENFWILPNGLRFPKDQVLGKLFGNVAEKSYAQWRKGKFEPSDILRSIKENFTPDRFMPATADIVLGGLFNYDSFYKSAIVPEYMQNKLGHLLKDLSTSNMASDVSNFLWKYTRTDISAKRLDWAILKNLTNCKKYVDAIYDLCKQTYDPKSFNEKMARGYDKNDSTGAFVGGLKDDVPKPLSLITGTFATNRTNYKSISDFYEKYNEYKTLATDEGSMSKEEKRTWKRYELAYKKDKNYRKQLREIKQDSSLTGKEKREKADKIFKQQIKLAKWAEG